MNGFPRKGTEAARSVGWSITAALAPSVTQMSRDQPEFPGQKALGPAGWERVPDQFTLARALRYAPARSVE